MAGAGAAPAGCGAAGADAARASALAVALIPSRSSWAAAAASWSCLALRRAILFAAVAEGLGGPAEGGPTIAATRADRRASLTSSRHGNASRRTGCIP